MYSLIICTVQRTLPSCLLHLLDYRSYFTFVKQLLRRMIWFWQNFKLPPAEKIVPLRLQFNVVQVFLSSTRVMCGTFWSKCRPYEVCDMLTGWHIESWICRKYFAQSVDILDVCTCRQVDILSHAYVKNILLKASTLWDVWHVDRSTYWAMDGKGHDRSLHTSKYARFLHTNERFSFCKVNKQMFRMLSVLEAFCIVYVIQSKSYYIPLQLSWEIENLNIHMKTHII